MIDYRSNIEPEVLIKEAFRREGINIYSLEQRSFPEEIIYIVKVSEDDFLRGGVLGNKLDFDLQQNGIKGFVTVRILENKRLNLSRHMRAGVKDQKATQLTSLINAHSRASELQPSLNYIPDTAFNIKTATAKRHHLIFGRRGVGKTALMVEAKKRVTKDGHVAVWINLQTLRRESVVRAYCIIFQNICNEMQIHLKEKPRAPLILSLIIKLNEELESVLNLNVESSTSLARLIPKCQKVMRRFIETTSTHFYIFIDELHYFERELQPVLLDALHGSIRDCNTWLKIAGIRHLSRWFQQRPPLGLQTGHDADHIDLDITLESPSRAKKFLEQILSNYANNVSISSLSTIIVGDALDRLVLASGAVPRDYLVLCGGAIRVARQKERARLIGVQDVNKAAGDAAKIKLTELDEDTSGTTIAQDLITDLNIIRKFCLDEKKYTFFRIEFTDKETHPNAYGKIQDLMDLRLLHLIDASLSDPHHAGKRSEVYMLDLSQFSGQRLKKNLKALDFSGGHLVLKETGTKKVARFGITPTQRIGILRLGPLLPLSALNRD